MADKRTPRSPEREWIFHSKNPWATIEILGEPVESEAQRKSNALRKLGNPYAKLSVFPPEEMVEPLSETPFEQGQLDFIQIPGRVLGTRPTTNKKSFERECRRILSQYEPLSSGKKVLRSEFRSFIAENSVKSAIARGSILENLKRYDLGKKIQPHLNRERRMDLLEKLKKISTSHPE